MLVNPTGKIFKTDMREPAESVDEDRPALLSFYCVDRLKKIPITLY